jgi:hypothetical protein
MIGVRADGTREVIALDDGHRESTESWLDLLRGCKRRGTTAPVLAVGDGALGFWSVPARYSRTASSSNDPTNQRAVISKSRDTPVLTHRPPWPPPSRVPSPGYAFPQPLTRVTTVI